MFKLSSLYAMLSAALGVNATPTRTYLNSRPTGAALRNPADPVQAARIEAAAVKRARKAEKQSYQAMRTLNGMHAVICAAYAKHEVGFACPLNLNPFYVAK
jgi:hypothetical protein